MMQIVLFLIGILKVISFVLNVRKNPLCFIIWGSTDTVLIVHNYNIGEYGQMSMWIMYFCLSIWGFNQWRKENDNEYKLDVEYKPYNCEDS